MAAVGSSGYVWQNPQAANMASFAGTGASGASMAQATQMENQYLQSQMKQQAPQAINMSGAFSGASSGLQDIMKQLTAAQNQANAANQQRYQDILGMYSTLGQSGAQQIQEQTAQQQAKSTADLTSRGLGNTTITSAMGNQIASLGQSNQLALQESLTGKEAGVMEAMNQQGPNLSMYANLIQQAMAGQQANQKRTVFGGYAPTYQAGGWNPAAYAEPAATASQLGIGSGGYFNSAGQPITNASNGSAQSQYAPFVPPNSEYASGGYATGSLLQNQYGYDEQSGPDYTQQGPWGNG